MMSLCEEQGPFEFQLLSHVSIQGETKERMEGEGGGTWPPGNSYQPRDPSAEEHTKH